MEHGYKHFSHSHNLIMHQLPEGVGVTCSGCNSSGNGNVCVCWQCNFFLHEQCYRATRSLKHPSHPPHPLTLVPYPTYPSNSFYCNSCEIIGTGLSYSCARCEFDLHVQCAYSISIATSLPKTQQYPTNYYNPDHQELVPPNWHGQNSSMAENIASVSVPVVSRDYQPDNHVDQSGQNQLDHNGIMHFSHPHSLRMVNLQDVEKELNCSGCEETLDGKGTYTCAEPDCDFHLHESCFHLKKEIQHKSHTQHPLTLLPLAPYNNENGGFTCNACFRDGTGFTYHCSVCKFDLHVRCVSLPETVKRSDHDHMLKLFYSCPVKGEEYTFSCDVCHVTVEKDRWAYYCETCDYGTHLGCVDREECVIDSLLEAQVQLQTLQLQMQMTGQNAQFQIQMAGQNAQMMANTSANLGHVFFSGSRI